MTVPSRLLRPPILVPLAALLIVAGVGSWSARRYLAATGATITALQSQVIASTQRSANALELLAEARRHSDSVEVAIIAERSHASALARAADALRAERERIMGRVSPAVPPVALSPAPVDSSALARTTRALDLAVAETDTLRAALAARDALEAMQVQQLTLLRSAVDSVSAALGGSQALVSRQAQLLARLEPRCRLVFAVPCPSRRVTLAAGLLAGVGVSLSLRR